MEKMMRVCFFDKHLKLERVVAARGRGEGLSEIAAGMEGECACCANGEAIRRD